jgi:hypothetical protein
LLPPLHWRSGLRQGIIFLEEKEDKTPPVIKCEFNQIKASIETPMEDLLLGVTAWDEGDGDVSESLFVEGCPNLSNPERAASPL